MRSLTVIKRSLVPRQIHKQGMCSYAGMALLTDPNSGDGKITRVITNRSSFICVLLYTLGIAWFLCLAHRSFNNGTYFSENALLPGLVENEFDEDLMAKDLYAELNEIMQYNPDDIPFEWLLQKFKELSMDTYLHNFSLNYPLSHNRTYYGQNIYAILRAPRSSSIEGLIVTAPFRTLNGVHPDNTASIALMLALAKFCRKAKYWAKDIIFLVTDHEQLGTQAWLEAYHNIQLGNGILNYGNITGRVGSIQAAINLEFHSTKFSHIDVKIEGLNGQLPNLDLFNLVQRLCKNEGIRHTFKNRGNPLRKYTSSEQWYHSLTTLVSMVLTQASCVPNGNHGLYHRFGIEAVTLESYAPPMNYRRQVSGLYQAGRVLEGILRSLNNLLERFHQSYFFYLLPSNDRFIPIGTYMPSVSFIGAPLLIKGLTIWLKIYNYFKPKSKKEIEQYEESSGLTRKNEMDSKQLKFTSIAFVFLVSHLFGWFYANSAVWFSKTGFNFGGFSARTSIYIGFFVLSTFTVIISHLFNFNGIESNFLNIVALLELATLLLIIAMHNFSLSLILSIIYVPCVCFISAGSGWKRNLLQSFIMLIIHPFVLMHLVVLGYTYVTQGCENIIAKAFSAVQYFFVYIIMDDMIYGNWLLKALFGFLIPNWIMFWIFAHS